MIIYAPCHRILNFASCVEIQESFEMWYTNEGHSFSLSNRRPGCQGGARRDGRN